MKSRFYDPWTGRFLRPDSIVPDPANPQSLNRYSYVFNDPLRYTDPTGHVSMENLWQNCFVLGCGGLRSDPPVVAAPPPTEIEAVMAQTALTSSLASATPAPRRNQCVFFICDLDDIASVAPEIAGCVVGSLLAYSCSAGANLATVIEPHTERFATIECLGFGIDAAASMAPGGPAAKTVVQTTAFAGSSSLSAGGGDVIGLGFGIAGYHGYALAPVLAEARYVPYVSTIYSGFACIRSATD